MTDDLKSKDEIQHKLWDEIKHSRFGMLGVADDVRQFQPMTAIPEPPIELPRPAHKMRLGCRLWSDQRENSHVS